MRRGWSLAAGSAIAHAHDRSLVRQLTAVGFSLVICGSALSCQNRQGAAVADRSVVLPFTRELRLHSSINGQEYRLFVALPPNYSENDTTRYNVLYVLDGNDEWPLAVEAHRLRRAFPRPRWPEFVIVGIGYPVTTYLQSMPYRSADLTIERGAEDSIFIRPSGLNRHTGEGVQFVSVLRGEIIPLIERQVRTTPDRGIIGHSLGARFVAYLLFTHTDLFARYGILSAAFDQIFAHERVYANTHRALNKRVFISRASNDGPWAQRTTPPMLDTLRARGYAGLSLDSQTFAGDHFSVLPAEIGYALEALGYDPPTVGP
jgi:predicted alpha/beta superfamily hydrolase